MFISGGYSEINWLQRLSRGKCLTTDYLPNIYFNLVSFSTYYVMRYFAETETVNPEVFADILSTGRVIDYVSVGDDSHLLPHQILASSSVKMKDFSYYIVEKWNRGSCTPSDLFQKLLIRKYKL